jgi:hypothetical protein
MPVITRNRPRTPSPLGVRKKNRTTMPRYNPWPSFLFDAMQEIIKTKELPALAIERIIAIIKTEESDLNTIEPGTALLHKIKLINPEEFLAELKAKEYLFLGSSWPIEKQYASYLDLLHKPLREWIKQNFEGSPTLCRTLQSGRVALIKRLSALALADLNAENDLLFQP